MAPCLPQVTKENLASLSTALSKQDNVKVYVEQNVQAEGRQVFFEEWFNQKNPALRSLHPADASYWAVAAEASTENQANTHLGLFGRDEGCNASPTERFSIVTYHEEPLRWMARREMVIQGIQSGDMLNIGKRTAFADGRETSSDGSDTASLHLDHPTSPSS